MTISEIIIELDSQPQLSRRYTQHRWCNGFCKDNGTHKTTMETRPPFYRMNAEFRKAGFYLCTICRKYVRPTPIWFCPCCNKRVRINSRGSRKREKPRI